MYGCPESLFWHCRWRCCTRPLPLKVLHVGVFKLWKYLQILSFHSVCSLMGNCFDIFHQGLHNKLRQKSFVCVVLISLVGIWACQNCISGFPCSACSGCSVRREVENALLDDFSEGQGAECQGQRIQNKVAAIVLRIAITDSSCWGFFEVLKMPCRAPEAVGLIIPKQAGLVMAFLRCL